jgi:hypothetical protein
LRVHHQQLHRLPYSDLSADTLVIRLKKSKPIVQHRLASQTVRGVQKKCREIWMRAKPAQVAFDPEAIRRGARLAKYATLMMGLGRTSSITGSILMPIFFCITAM